MKKTLINRPVRDMVTVATMLALTIGTQRASAQRALGVDVSNYQGLGINWGSVKGSGISFAWVLATDGSSFVDSDFAGDMNNGKGAGVYMGAYHFARPNLNSPATEAAHFWSVAGSYIVADGKSFMPMLDMEVFSGHVGASSYSDWANQWCNAIVADAAAAGVTVKPVIYMSTCNTTFFDSSIAQWTSDIANYNGQSAQSGSPWNSSGCTPNEVWGSGVWSVWQYSSSGSVPGISGGSDVDVFNGTVSQLASTMVVTTVNNSAFVGPIQADFGGEMEIFGTDTNGAVWHDWQVAPSSGWNPWGDLGEGAYPGVVATRNLNGAIEIFVVANDGNIWHNWQNGPNGSWVGWISLGGLGTTNLVATCNANGCLQIFGIGSNTDIWTIWQTSPGGSWSAWTDLGGPGTKAGFVVGKNPTAGTLELFGVGSDGNVWHNWETSPSGTHWNGWLSMGGISINPRLAIGCNADGRLQIFGLTNNGHISTTWQNSPAGSWSPWTDMGVSAQPGFVVGKNKDGRMELFATTGGSPVHIWQTAPSSGWTTSWLSLGTTPPSGLNSQLVVGNNSDGRVQVFGKGGDEDVWTTWQNAPGSTWSAWTDMGGAEIKFYVGQ